MTASRLLSPLKSVPHDLGAVLGRYLGIKLPKELGNSDWGAFQLSKEQTDYAKNDVRYLIQLAEALQKALTEAELEHVFALEMVLLPLVTKMEVFGIRFNSLKAQALLALLQAKTLKITRALQLETGIENLNPLSSPHCVEYFRAKDSR
jgi:ribonuclease D